MSDEFKRNVGRKRYFYFIESLLYNFPRIITATQRSNRMRYDNKVERGFLANGNKLLELTKRVLVLTEEIRKFIPNQNDFRVVLIDDIQDPIFEIVCSK